MASRQKQNACKNLKSLFRVVKRGRRHPSPP